MIITYDEPGILYDDPRVTYDGVFADASVWPAESTVSLGVQYGPNGVDFTGSAIAGNGAQIIAYRSNVQMATPTLRATSREKRRDSFQARKPTTLRAKPRSKKYVYATTCVKHAEVFTSTDEIYVTTITESTEI